MGRKPRQKGEWNHVPSIWAAGIKNQNIKPLAQECDSALPGIFIREKKKKRAKEGTSERGGGGSTSGAPKRI